MTASALTTTRARTAEHLTVVSLGASLSAFLAISYVLCVLYGLAVPGDGFHRTLMPMLLPGFAWISWPSFFIGLAWVVAYGWYVAILFVPLYRYFASRTG